MNKPNILLALALGVSALGARAEVTLPKILSDSMVVQHSRPVRLWGKADPGEEIAVKVDGKKKASATADSLGAWSVEIEPLKAGKTHSIAINDRQINNVEVGEVLLCSGQSNMELPVSRVMDLLYEDVLSYENPSVRQFLVPKETAFDGELADVAAPAAWHGATQANTPAFSAVAYFAARELAERTGMPVGIINASWGGTPVESWISEEYLRPYPLERNKLAQYSDANYRRLIKEKEAADYRAWESVMDTADPGLNGPVKYYSDEMQTWGFGTGSVPDQYMRTWATDGMNPINGSHWLRRDFNVDAAHAGQPAWLRMGCIVDADSVWVNGVKVGNTTYQYPPRIYPIPAGLLREGANSVTVRVISQHGTPHFVPEKPYKVVFGQPYAVYGRTEADEISLDGTWFYAPGAPMPPGPDMMFFCYLPEVLYDGMIAPVINYPVGNVVWYQGESNVANSNRYPALLTSLINCWRANSGNQQLPFHIVELADYLHPSDTGGRSAWQQMRRRQAETAASLPGVTLVHNSDLGEWNDIHPLDKKTLGTRIADSILNK